MKTGPLYTTSLVLVLVGALNWLLVGLFSLDLVAFLLGDMSVLARFVYILVGLSAIYVGYESLGEKGHNSRTTLHRS